MKSNRVLLTILVAMTCTAVAHADGLQDTDGRSSLLRAAVGACCVGGTVPICTVVDEATCETLSGTFMGEGTRCDPDTCPKPGACCFPDGTCEDPLSIRACEEAGGIPQEPRSRCEDVECPEVGACCLLDGTCIDEVTEEECDLEGGIFQGGGSTCDSVECVEGGFCGCMDVIFVVDDTGSMGPAIDNVKLGLEDILDASIIASGGDLQLGVVTYNDEVEVDQPLTGDVDAVRTAINALFASGGSGEPEASDQALHWIVNGMSDCATGDVGSLRDDCLRILVQVTDARPGGCDDAYADGIDDVSAVDVANDAAALGIRIAPVLVDNGDIPSAAHPGGVERFVMGAYADITGTFLTVVPADGTGTGDAIAEIIEECGGGACCFVEEGRCEETTQEDCDTMGGEFFGVGTRCRDVPCPAPGACCLPDGTCEVLFQEECEAEGGDFFGEGTDCDMVECGEPGACCLPDGTCDILLEGECLAEGGEFQGEGVDCTPPMLGEPGRYRST
jgi:uncharacterized protein YegL